MDSSNIIYKEKSWKPSSTVSDKNTFFHAAFGVRANETDPYVDKRVTFHRMRWATFLTYFENDDMPPELAGILRKCLFENEKNQKGPFEDQHQFESYVSDIMKAERDVALEEIPIIATLENVTVVLFSDGIPEPIIISPNVEILGRYPNTEKSKGEVVLYLQRGIFTRMNVIITNPTAKSFESEEKMVEEDWGQLCNSLIRYQKGGSAGSEGVQYQVGLLTIFFLNALQKLTYWKLSTENKMAGKFDDVVLEWPGGATLVQSKHKQHKNKKITFEELMSSNSKNEDFSLPKYFSSYEDNKKKFKLKNVILCTNAGVNEKAMKFLKAQEVETESMLHYEGCNCKFYTFSDEILPHLKENVRSYYENNLRNKGIDGSTITDENIKDFLGHLQFYPNYPPSNSVGNITEQLLSKMKRSQNCYGQISPLEIYTKILDWFQQKDGIYLNELYAKAIFSEIWRDKRWERLQKYNVFFQRNNLNFQTTTSLFHLTSEDGYLLQEIKIFRALQDKTKILFLNAYDCQKQKEVLEAFGLPQYTILVLTCPTTTEEYVINYISSKLREVLDKYRYKKVVLVADSTNKIPQHIGLGNDSYLIMKESVTLEDLSVDTQERLLKMENVQFQGMNISLEKLLAQQVIEDYGRFLNSEALEKLVRKEKIKVGAPPMHLDITQFYIKRNFNRCFKCENGINVRNEIVPEDLICEINEKVMVISDGAGMGKSTVLASLATTIKKKHFHLWIIRIDLNDYTQILKDFLGKNKTSINILELLDSKHSTKLTNQLERAVFSMNGKVVLMLDGFDEISPDYTELVLNLLCVCRDQENFAKIIVTTRPHLADKLKRNLQVEPFVLEPFTEQNQIHFLTSYWMHNLGVDRVKCEQYAKALICKLPVWIRLFQLLTPHFGMVPLHVRMLAEIFQENNQFEIAEHWEGCKEYSVTVGVEPKLPANMNITRLYQMFIQKKRNIFIDKGNPSGNTAANQALIEQFEECMAYHKSLALELILDETQCKLFSTYRQTSGNLEINVLKIGIVQKTNDKFNFVHRTFAEYFVAECLIEELQLQHQTVEFQKFFIEEILFEVQFNVTCSFFNSFLQPIVDDLSSKIFHKYQSVSYPITSSLVQKFDLLHHLAKNGYVAILQLILKCIDLNFVTQIPDFTELVDSCFRGGNPNPMHCNILNILHAYIYQQGFDVKDMVKDKTLLEYASVMGQLQMVKFLVNQGANVNIGNFTPLHLAVNNDHFEVTKFLVEQGADIRAKHPFNHVTVLYTSVTRNDAVTATYLLDTILKTEGLNTSDSIVPYMCAYLGRLDILKMLAKSGLDPNMRAENEETLIFGAARGGQQDIVRYLVRQGTDINARDKWNNTALHVIAGHASLFSTAELLVELEVDIDAQNLDFETAFHFAVEKSNFDLIKLLVNRRTNVNLKYKDGNTALHKAALSPQKNIFKFLVDNGADIKSRNKYDYTALHLVIISGTDRLVNELFVRHSYNLVTSEHTLDAISFLIERGVDVDIKDGNGNAAFHLAAASGQLDMVVLFVKSGVNTNIKDREGRTALHIAVLKGHSHIVKFLVHHKVDVNARDKYGNSVLHYLVKSKDHLDVLKLILQNNGDVNVRNNQGQTPLHLTIDCNNFDAVVLLKEFRVDVNIRDCFGNTALHLAVEESRLRIVEYLVKVGADVTIKNIHLRTPLHIAAKGRTIECVPRFTGKDETGVEIWEKLFILKIDTGKNVSLDMIEILFAECSIIINDQDIAGSTPLHLAVLKGRMEVIEFLVAHKADVNIKNYCGQTALQLAAENGSQDIAELLMEYGADVDN